MGIYFSHTSQKLNLVHSMSNGRLVSIVIPSFNEEDGVQIFWDRLSKVLLEIEEFDFELIFVDDCSTDKTLTLISSLKSSKKIKIRIFHNTRNYGVYKSCFRILRECSGDYVIPMLPIDLQDPPELIPDMLNKMSENFDSVAGRRYLRDENFFMRGIRRNYYRFVSKFASFSIPPHVGEFQLVKAEVIRTFAHSEDYYPYIRALIANSTSNTYYLDYEWESRKFGKSKHNLIKLYDQGINGIVSTSKAPLRFMVLIGMFISVACFGVALLQILAFFTFAKHKFSSGVPSLTVGLYFLFGITFLFLGIVGEYIGAIHSQLRLNNVANSKELFND